MASETKADTTRPVRLFGGVFLAFNIVVRFFSTVLASPYFKGLAPIALTLLIYFFCWRIFVFGWKVTPPSIFSLSDILNIAIHFVSSVIGVFALTFTSVYSLTLIRKRSIHSPVRRMYTFLVFALFFNFLLIANFSNNYADTVLQTYFCFFNVIMLIYLFNVNPGGGTFDGEDPLQWIKEQPATSEWLELRLIKTSASKVQQAFWYTMAFGVVLFNSACIVFILFFLGLLGLTPIIVASTNIETRIIEEGFYGGQIKEVTLEKGLADDCLMPTLLWMGERNVVLRCAGKGEIAIPAEKTDGMIFGRAIEEPAATATTKATQIVPPTSAEQPKAKEE
jgi:hypothetical protein